MISTVAQILFGNVLTQFRGRQSEGVLKRVVTFYVRGKTRLKLFFGMPAERPILMLQLAVSIFT